MTSSSLDLRGTPCPVNFIRCRLALEALQPGDLLNVQLDRGEPEQMVIPGLREAGHRVEISDDTSSWIVLRVVCGG